MSNNTGLYDPDDNPYISNLAESYEDLLGPGYQDSVLYRCEVVVETPIDYSLRALADSLLGGE